MYRLMIVDDEHHVVDWLFELFMEKSGLDLDIIKAYSGKDALSILETSKIDVVLSDIRMPGINGLELLEKVCEKWPNSKMIFLTGFNEFDYVYKAIKHEGVSYLLKTEDDDEIINAVKKAIESLEKDLRNRELLSRELDKEILILHLMQKDMLLDIINNKIAYMDIDQTKLEKLEISLRIKQPVILLLGHINDTFANRGHLEQYKNIISLKYLTEKYLAKDNEYSIIDIDKYNILWIMQPKKVLLDNTTQVENDKVSQKAILYIKEMLEMFQTVCKESLDMEILFLFYNKPVLWESIGETLDAFKSIANRRAGLNTEMPAIYYVNDKNETFNDANIIQRIKSFIKDNINGELTLIRISECVNYNPSYVSRFFKQTTGTNLFDHINKVRINKAKELLENNTESIQNIAKAVGFDSSQYFATAFKKMTGMTPHEYRSEVNK